MKIELVHVRDPDAGCTIALFVDGVETEDFDLVTVDAGASYTCSDVLTSLDAATQGASEAAQNSIASAYETALASEFTEHERDANDRCTICDDGGPDG